jgi:hypothetical protein
MGDATQSFTVVENEITSNLAVADIGEAEFDAQTDTAVAGSAADVIYQWETDAESLKTVFATVDAAECYGKYGIQYSSDGTGISGVTGPVASFVSVFENDGGITGKVGVPVYGLSMATAASSTVAGGFFRAATDNSTITVTEAWGLRVQCAVGANDTLTGGGGIFIEADTDTSLGATAIQIGGINSGAFLNGVTVRKVAAAGFAFGVGPSLACDSGLNLAANTSGFFTTAAIKLGNGATNGSIEFDSNDSLTKAYIYMEDDAADTLIIKSAAASNGVEFQDSAGTTTFLLHSDGTLDVKGTAIEMQDTKVIGVRETGWTTAAGVGVKNNGTWSTVDPPTNTELGGAVKAIMDALILHGLIGT